jgi:hypothetical protein
VCKEDKPKVETSENCGFGAMTEIIRNLGREEEELEQIRICPGEVPAINTAQDQIELLKEISTKLKEIAETQKAILEEIKKNKIK